MVHAETRYPGTEKLAFALLIDLRKLKLYFQAHVIGILTNHPMKQVLHCLEALSQLMKWSKELSQ